MATKAAKKETFIWEGKDSKGQKTQGETMGASVALVKADLRRQGVNPTKVRKKPKPLFGGGGKTKITPSDISIFARQLATMMDSGVPLVQSFEIIGKGHENQGMSNLLNAVKNDIEGGTTLSEALAKHPLQFDELFCNLVQAGEHAGILDSILDKIATYKEKTEAIKGKIKKAMTYPMAIMVVAFIITVILLIFVIPQFEQLFSGFGADLPAMTKFVVKMSEWMQAYWWALFAGIGIVVKTGLEAKKRSKAFNIFLDKYLLKAPVIGSILHKAAIARYARTLSTMFAAGVPLVEAMDSVSGAVGNVVYKEAVLKMRDEVSTGTQINTAMKQAKLFPHMVVQMTAIGEEAGSVDTMLSKVADFYEAEVDDAVDNLTALLEPMIMAFLGVVIGGLVIAMYLPIFQMGKVVS
ncbi:MAG: type II secretion system F family protein [Gammaproteobacteria bacterium]|nr:type II secretion system F family protein [Gammaproteobacteria bacterium]MCW8988295.1 type II secretion system F family protein [Gammaproteobacteria bacterium]MCW9031316.1 type II secretion system F family protein [Gammaproteobacteria bacterium]